MSESKPNLKSILKNSADTMIKFVQKYNMQNNQQKDLIHLFHQLDSNKNKINGKNKKLSYGIVDLKQLCIQSEEFVLNLQKMLHDKQFVQMVNESQHMTYACKCVYRNGLKEYYLDELKKPQGRFNKIAGGKNQADQLKLYHDSIQAEQYQNQNQNLRDSQIDQNNYALEQKTALRNSTTSVESLSIGDDQFAPSDQEQGRQNNQASYHNEEQFQEEDQIDFQNTNNDFINLYEY